MSLSAEVYVLIFCPNNSFLLFSVFVDICIKLSPELGLLSYSRYLIMTCFNSVPNTFGYNYCVCFSK